MKKALSFVLALLMLTAIFATFPAKTNTAVAATVISNQSPAVTGNVGATISLSGYSVELKDGTVLSNPTWTYNGNTVTSVKFDAAGVYKLTAAQNGKSRTVYAVIKKATDTEYVLYRNDFNSADDIKGLATLGISSTTGSATVANGKLTIDAYTNDTYTAAVYMPTDVLADFGNYNIEVSANMSKAKDNGRWFSIAYRHVSDSNYMHFCIRQNAAGTNGLEAVKKVGTSWQYLLRTPYTEALGANKYYTFTINAFDDILNLSVNGKTVAYFDDVNKAGQVTGGTPATGKIGLQANQCVMNFDYIKVTIAETAPEYQSSYSDPLIVSKHDTTNILNGVTNVAMISESQVASVLGATVKPNAVLVEYSGAITSAKLDTLYNECKKNGVVFGVVIKTSADATTLYNWCSSKSFWDVTVAGTDGNVLKTLRGKSSTFRTMLIASVAGKTAQAVRADVRKYGTNGVIIPASESAKKTVQALQELHLTVWSSATDADKTDIAWMITSGAHGIVTDTPALVTDVMKNVFKARTLTKTPSLIGHRGNPSMAPENSISGYKTAVENGATEVECDIYLTSDGELIIMHDATLNRTTNYTGSKYVTQMSLSEIKQYYLLDKSGKVSDEKVPTLKEMFEALKNHEVYYVIELKSGDQAMVAPLYKLIKQYGVQDRVNIISFDGNVLKTTYNTDPIISAGYLSGSLKYNENYFDKAAYHSNIFDLIKAAQSYNASINISYGNTSTGFYQKLNDRAVTLWPWTYGQNDVNMYHGFISGFDGLTTDYAQYLKNCTMDFDTDKVGNYTLKAGETMKIKSTAKTFGKITSDVSTKVGIAWIENEIGAAFDTKTGTFTAGKENGTVSFMLTYQSKLPDNAVYVLYSQPITVEVTGGSDTPANTLGDVNKDGKINSFDYLLVRSEILGLLEFNDEQTSRADVTGDGKIDSFDYILIRSHILGLTVIKGWEE